MEYSAALAPNSKGWFLINFLFFLFGSWQLRETCFRRFVLKNFVVGLVVTAVMGYVIAKAVVDTRFCRSAESKGKVDVVSGVVRNIQVEETKHYKHIVFSINGRTFKTYTVGLSECDCGYILPVGKVLKIKEGMDVEIKAYKETVLALKIRQ